MKKFLKRGLLVVVVAGVVAAIAMAFRPQPVLVDTARVSRGNLEETVDEDGRTRIRERYIVSAPLNGRLQRIVLDPGDEVSKEAAVVATVEPLDPSLLNERTLAETRARVNAAQSAVKRAGSLVERSRATLDRAESELARVRKLSSDNAVSTDRLEAVQLTYRTAGRDYQAAVFSQEIAEFEHELAQAALVRSGDSNETSTAEYLVIRAPISGEVLRVFEENSRVVSPGTPLLEIGDPADLELEIDVLSTDAVKIRAGQKVKIDHWGGHATLRGEVRLIEPSAFTKISALGVEEQRVNVIVDLTDPVEQREGLGDAFRVEAHIITWDSNDVLKIPSSSLFRSGEQWSVFVVREDHARLVPVTPGHRSSTEVEIVEGLTTNDEIVLYPGDRIRDGAAVAVRE